MNKNKLGAFVAGAALAALAAGCQSMNTNNANGNTVPANTGVVTNNNGNTNTAGVTTTNTSNMNGSMMNGNASRGNYNANITREEYNRDKDRYSGEARQAGRTVGSGVNDGWIWTKARASLATENDLRDSTVNVDVDNGVVTLTGTVANQSQKSRAQTIVNALDGVKSVRNNLQVSASGNTNANMNSNTRR
ncbi:MAG: BON domain-containing protein [Pyrinomonadaceae bacterium]|nr:BON domain-containing protein [Pyrinomonadaceae bacterium]